MTWIALIEQELPRLRLYASALLGGPPAGDTAVEEMLCDLIKSWLPTRPDRFVMFSVLDTHVRGASSYEEADRIELLQHVCGFTAEECREMVAWTSNKQLKTA